MGGDPGARGWRLLLAGAAASAVVAAPLPDQGAAASCAAPYLLVGGDQDPPALAVGSRHTVTGRAFVNGCDDVGGQTVWGCSTDEGEVETPMTDVRLRIRQESRTWELGEADAGAGADLGHVTWRVRLPGELEPGRASLLADHAEPVRVRVVGSPRGAAGG